MDYYVIVSGVPSDVKLGKIVQMFSFILSMPSRNFHVKLLPSQEHFREVAVTFSTHSDAYLAQELLDNFVYRYKTVSTVFKATMHEDNEEPIPKSNCHNPNMRSPEQEEEHHQNRPQSPDRLDKSPDLDMQINVEKKQSKIMEEKKKLEQNEQLELLKNETKKRRRLFQPKVVSIEHACRAVMKMLTTFIYKYASAIERTTLDRLLRTKIKERMATVIAAYWHPHPRSQTVMDLYRLRYPPEDDEEFVKAALQDLKNLLSGTPIATVSSSPAGPNANKVDGSDKAAGDSDVSESIQDNEKSLFLFYEKAITTVMKDMEVCLNKHLEPSEKRDILVDYLRLTVTTRIVSVVADMPEGREKASVISIYRTQYPHFADEDFIKQKIKDIDEGRVLEDEVVEFDTYKSKQKVNSPDKSLACTSGNKTPQEKLTIQEGTDTSDTTQKCSDNMEVNECHRGVKRKNDEEENDSIKAHKSGDIVVIGSENTTEVILSV